MGYNRILHIESGTAISAANALVASRGHIFCKP